jgi:iturin family lipopeptide synthetase A
MKRASSLRTASEIVKAALDRELERDARAPSAPRDATARQRMDHIEELLATIVGGVLGTGHIQSNARFSELGGNSLMATRVLSRVWRAFGVKLPLSTLIPDGSVSSLAGAVRRLRDVDRKIEPVLQSRAECGPMDVSPNQAAVWFLESLGDAGPIYNIPYGVRIEGPLDADALRQSLNELVARHEALQLRFEIQAGRVVQERGPGGRKAGLPVIDISDRPSAKREVEAMTLASRHVRAPFDLSRPPLIRFLLIKIGPEDHMLVLAIHHIVCDAWSIKVMMRQLSENYSGSVGRRQAPEFGFLDFVAWQRDALSRSEIARLVEEWRDELQGASDTPACPGHYPRSESISRDGAIEPIELDVDLVRKLRDFSGDQATSLYMTLLAAFAVAVNLHMEKDRVTIGSPIANRQHESFEEVVGYIANMLPMRVDLSGNPTLRQLLARVRSVALAAYDRQDLPFAQLVRELEPSRNPGTNPLFQVALIVNDLSPLPLGPTQVSEVLLHTGTAKFDVTCYLEERDGRLAGYLEYAVELFRPETITRLRMAFERTLEAMLEYVDQPLSECVSGIVAGVDSL